MKNIHKENTDLILSTLVSSNESLLKQLKENNPDLSKTEINIAFLLKLGFSPSEIKILLETEDKVIQKLSKIIIFNNEI